MSREADAHAEARETEIEITSAMVFAGACVVEACPLGDYPADYVAREVFRAMAACLD